MIEQLRRRIGRAGYFLIVLGLAAGTALSFLDQTAAARGVLVVTICTLVLLPVVNVVAVLAEEIARRDWTFVSLALTVLALVGWSIAERL